MKNIVLATAITLTASTAFAGALTDPQVEPDVIIEHTTAASGHDILVPIMFLILMGVALTGGNAVPNN